ncbi:allantoicase-like [Anabrus simplex]|uniref:allantoicase-like n=1 Tax=Anabrus simplex TaxID=316456 RepID=UPI0035A38EB7
MAERRTQGREGAPTFTELNDLCAQRNGGEVVFATDDWFAVAENLIKAEEPVWHEGEFTDCGKWMDGWETRRKRTPGHDWALLKLGVPGVVRGIVIDTAFFTGNYAPRFSLQAACLSVEDEESIPARKSELGGAATPDMLKQIAKLKSEDWVELVPRSTLQGGYKDTRYNYFAVDSDETWTHLRLNMYPDGGIARLRVYGVARPDWATISADKPVDLISMMNGGLCVGYSDAHYGHPRNIIRPGIGVNMGDGWETARRLDRPCILEAVEDGILQVPGCEWAIFQLGHCGYITLVEVDTSHFKGNYPDSIRIEGTKNWSQKDKDSIYWELLLPPKKLSPHKQHFFSDDVLMTTEPVSHIRVIIAPDGGISRLRLWGYLERKIL